ncbi:hypothetical protein GQE99_01195 [Maritimibacter sp. DP07]|uniref:Uncharacterized protein n=1 Tax=Maritimibacter harenae TaxID=2606218 RepID=A0A845LZY2_9RHOB|nr:hypothetical protein [Maritimibacter harenae]MZR11648.1 hypothetical protein [Maritimibacter harenae]
MPNDKTFRETGQRLGELLKSYSPHERKRIWRHWYGDRLVETVKSLEKGAGPLEAQWLADGRLDLEGGVYSVDDEDFAKLIGLAVSQPEAFDLARAICASRLEVGASLSVHQRRFAAGVLQDLVKRPKKKGRPRSKNWNRDVLIVHGVATALQQGLQEMRWETSETPCAYSVVADAFNEAGNLLVNYDVVRNVWRNRKKSGLEGEINDLESIAHTLQVGNESPGDS